MSVVRLGEHSQVPNHERLEEQAQRGHVAHEALVVGAERGSRQRRVGQMPLGRLAQRRLGTKANRPCRLFLHHEDPTQRAQIGAHRVTMKRLRFRIRAQRAHAGSGGDIACQRSQQPLHARGIVDGGVINTPDIGSSGLGQIAAQVALDLAQRKPQLPRPSAPAQHPRDFCEPQIGPARARGLPVEKTAQRHLARGVPRLEQRHGPHPDAAHAPCAGVAGGVVRRLSRPRQDEASRFGCGIDGVTHVVPQSRHHLPLVEQPRCLAAQQCRRVDAAESARVEIGVKADGTACVTQPRPGLAAAARPFQHEKPRRLKAAVDFTIDDPRPVPIGNEALGGLVFHDTTSAKSASLGARCTSCDACNIQLVMILFASL